MQEIADKLKSFFADKNNVSMAFLFGSAAADRLIPESDVDVAVWLNGNYTLDDVNKLQSEIADMVKRNIDLIDLNTARPTVAWAAMRGKPLIIRNYRLYLNKLLDFSREAEDFRNFIFDLWGMRRKLRGSFS
jgi:predicted nucleotidyltransferase